MDTKSGPLHAPELADVVAAADPDALADWLHHRALPADRSHNYLRDLLTSTGVLAPYHPPIEQIERP